MEKVRKKRKKTSIGRKYKISSQISASNNKKVTSTESIPGSNNKDVPSEELCA